MITLNEFLRARFVEDEEIRKAVIGHKGASEGLDIEVKKFNAYFCPERLRNEITAKYFILAHLEDAERDVARAKRMLGSQGSNSRDAQEAEYAAWFKLDAVLCIAKDIAAIYYYHKDYQEEWRLQS